MKSLIKDFFMVLFLSAVCGYAGWLLYNDLNQTIENTDGEPIGSVQFSSNVTQRKYAGRVVWETLPQQAIVYNNDTIRTAEDSEIVLMMEDGTEITLQANTLITLNFSDEEKNIEFQGGNISATSAGGGGKSALQIKTEDTTIALNDASINLNKQEGEEVSFAVLKGNVELESGGVKQEIKENEQVEFTGGQATVKELDLIPQRPLNNSFQLSYSEQKMVDFNWNYSDIPDTLNLLVSNNNDLSEPVLNQPVGEKSYRTLLTPGVYFWQLQGVQNEIEVESPITKFTILEDNPVIPLAPANGKEIEYRQNIPSISFRWEAMENADYYLLEVGTTSDLSAPIHSRQVTGDSLSIAGFSEGQYFWRVTPHVALGQLGFQNPTMTYNFSTLQNEEIKPPQLKYPPAETAFSYLETREGMRFNWSRVNEAREYQIQISNSTILDDPILDIKTEDNYLQTEIEWTPGIYYWQVACTSRSGEAIPPSEIRSFSVEEFRGDIELLQPANGTNLIENSGYAQRFTWKGNAEQYHFSLYKKEKEKETLVSESVTASTSMISVLPGDGSYTWGVDILDYSGEIISSSPTYTLNIESPFSPPFVILPAAGSDVSLIGEDSFSIRWLEAEKADYYSGYLERQRDKRTIAEMSRTSGTEWTVSVNDSWETGNYIFHIKSVREKAPEGYGKESDETIYTINIKDIVLFEAAVHTLPAEGASFSRLGILKDGINFSWTAHPLLTRFSIDLYRNGGKFPYRTLFSETTEIELNDMEDGSYQWQIHAWDSRGNQAPDSGLRRFSVSPVPELSRPEMISPIQGSTVNMDTTDSLDFSWNPVSNAAYYRLILTNTDTGDIIFVKDNFTGTSFSYTKLEKLDIGRFSLELQAHREYTDIGIKQSSPLTEINFSLTLETASEAPVIITSGSLYAE